DEAQTQAERGVAELRREASGPDAELAAGYETLGNILRVNLDYDAAIAAYRQAIAYAAGGGKAGDVDLANVGIIQAAMVTHPELATATADAMIADPGFAARPADLRSQLYALRARAALNRGDLKSAERFIDKALGLSGVLTANTISLSQEEVRSDAGLIFAKLGDREATHKYLAYSGAGQLPDEKWFSSADMDSPTCGPDIRPDDTAVVEFAIADNGRTAGAAPVFASRPGPMGVLFAQAVREWRWTPEAVAASKPFWRAAVRVEMRCASRPPALTLDQPFAAATRAWLDGKGVFADISNLAGPTQVGTTIDGDGLDAIPGLFRALAHRADRKTLAALGAELDNALVRNGAPPEARALAFDRAAHYGEGSLHAAGMARATALAAALPSIDRLQGGQRAAAWLRVEMAVALEIGGDFGAAEAPLETVVALPTSALAADDPIRAVAVLHLSLLDRKSGDAAAAEALRRQAGLTVQGCNLLDVRPIPTAMSANSDFFPDEANRWGFGGWVKTGYDIAADGKVNAARALVSYPPFIFDDAAEEIVSGFRYLPPSLGNEPLSCSGESKTVQFLPAPH
ncbi:MAG TPA: energy transducer TonB, partial [Caulobacteraceae bacterium]|nr:energy transducer TonB [Caulobacteraceae bacterium]